VAPAGRRPEWPEPQPARRAGAGEVWLRHPRRRGGALRRGGGGARPRHRLPPDERRGRADHLGAGMPRAGGGDRDQPGWLHHHLHRADGRPAGGGAAGDRGPHHQYPPPGGIPAAQLRLEGRDRGHRRAWRPGLCPGARGDGRADRQRRAGRRRSL
ncbi:MAG: 3-dehydroquinate dehydratase II, partial [uncultured Craurococcus sp.]